MRILRVAALLLLFSRESVASDDEASPCPPRRNDSFSDVLVVRKDEHSSPNLALLQELFVNAYNTYVSEQDCDGIHYRQVESVKAVVHQENDRELEFHVEGKCVECRSFQGLFDYNLNIKKKSECKCGSGALDELPTERAFVEYLNQVLQDSFEQDDESIDADTDMDDHVIYPARKLDASCPLGDDRLECLLTQASFTQTVQVTFGTGEDDLETPSSQQLELLGKALGELYNDYACRINDPRIVCSSTLEPGNDQDFTRVFTWTMRYDEAVVPDGLNQVFGAPVPFMPSSATERTLLSESFPRTCWLDTLQERLAVYPNNFVDYVNGQLPGLVQDGKYEDLNIFSFIISVSIDTPQETLKTLLEQSLIRSKLTITVDDGQELTRERGIAIGKVCTH